MHYLMTILSTIRNFTDPVTCKHIVMVEPCFAQAALVGVAVALDQPLAFRDLDGQLVSESARVTSSKAQCVTSSHSLMNSGVRVAACELGRNQMWSFSQKFPVLVEDTTLRI